MLPRCLRIGGPVRPARMGLLTVVLVALLAQAWGPSAAFGQASPQKMDWPFYGNDVGASRSDAVFAAMRATTRLWIH